MKLRISLSALMAFILIVALVLASLRSPTDLLAKVVFTLAIAAFGVALLGMLLSRGALRATWVGLFVFGAGYLALCFGPFCDTHINPRLVTTAVIEDRYRRSEYIPKRVGEKVWVFNEENVKGGDVGRVVNVPPSPDGEPVKTVKWDYINIANDRNSGVFPCSPTRLRTLSPDAYRQLCQSDLSLLFGFIGALIGRSFASPRSPNASSP
jgi:hypothetical protein